MAVSGIRPNIGYLVAYRKSIIAKLLLEILSQSFFFFFFFFFQFSKPPNFFSPHVTLLVDSFQHNQNGVSKTM